MQRFYGDPDSARGEPCAQDDAAFTAPRRSAVSTHGGWHDLDAQPDAAVDAGAPRAAHNVF